MTREDQIAEVARRIRESSTWVEDDCETLCNFAGIYNVWDLPDDDFEWAMFTAAEKLCVDIIE